MAGLDAPEIVQVIEAAVKSAKHGLEWLLGSSS
jgi:hypothetical protein